MSSLCIARVRTSKHLSAYSTDVLSHVVQLDNKGFDNKESDYKAAFAHSTFDNKAFDAQAVDNKAFDNLRRRLDKTAITTCEVSESWDNESELNFMMTPKRKLRILMLHGFGQSGQFFQWKTKKLVRHLESNISSFTSTEDPLDFEFFYPDAPVDLREGLSKPEYGTPTNDEIQTDMRAWWRILDDCKYTELASSIAHLTSLSQEYGPFDGVIGFSQGAAMALMFAALCEGMVNPQRRLATQGVPLLGTPPQKPLSLVIAIAGFKAPWDFCSGFYSPRISTPTLHIIGDLDIMICQEWSSEIISECEDPEVLHHCGGHFVPNQSGILQGMSSFIGRVIARNA